jgi:hypothetical protein
VEYDIPYLDNFDSDLFISAEEAEQLSSGISAEEYLEILQAEA